jgi:hypothetical protein
MIGEMISAAKFPDRGFFGARESRSVCQSRLSLLHLHDNGQAAVVVLARFAAVAAFFTPTPCPSFGVLGRERSLSLA